jgi:hypothetical protein
VIALADIAQLAERGDIVMRHSGRRTFTSGLLRHAVPNGHVAALCGFIPASSEWIDYLSPEGKPFRTCRACHFQLQRAGYSVSFSGRITRVEQAS